MVREWADPQRHGLVTSWQPLRRVLLLLCVCACATPASVREGAEDLDGQAAAVLHAQLQRLGVDDRFDYEAKVQRLDDAGLSVRVVCSGKTDHLLKAQVQVKAHGAPPSKLLTSMMAKAAKDLATDCR